jgi:hypothetical protein
MSGQQEGERMERYLVTFLANDKTYTYTARDAAEFSQFEVGSQWLLKVNGFGSIVDLQAR